MNRFISGLTHLTLFKEFAIWNHDYNYYNYQRFGQYVVNKYIKKNQTAPEIFYEENPRIAFDLLYKEVTN